MRIKYLMVIFIFLKYELRLNHTRMFFVKKKKSMKCGGPTSNVL